MIEQSHYNTYSSARYSNNRRTMYLALNRRGQPRKVQIRAQQQLGKLSTYTRVLTQSVSPERVEELINRLAAAHSHLENSTTHPLRHHGSATGHLCASTSIPQSTKHQADQPDVDKLRCRRRKKRKKKRRKCNDEKDGTCPNKPFAPPKQKCSDVADDTGNTTCINKPQNTPVKKCSEDDSSCNHKPAKLPSPKKKCSSHEDDGSCSDKPNKPSNPKNKCSSRDGQCSDKPNKSHSNAKRKCSPDKDGECGEDLNKSKTKCTNDDGACSDKTVVLNSKRKCSPENEDGPCGESSKKKCADGEEGLCPPIKNITRCENKDECQRIPNNKIVNKKNNKKNRFAQNVQLRVNKKQKNKKLKTVKNKKVLQKDRDFVEVTSSSISSSSSSRPETTTALVSDVDTEQATIIANMTVDMEMSSTTESQDVFTSDEDYSSKAMSSSSDETDSSQVSSWEDPFIPPYPDSTSEATPI